MYIRSMTSRRKNPRRSTTSKQARNANRELKSTDGTLTNGNVMAAWDACGPSKKLLLPEVKKQFPRTMLSQIQVCRLVQKGRKIRGGPQYKAFMVSKVPGYDAGYKEPHVEVPVIEHESLKNHPHTDKNILSYYKCVHTRA